MKVNLSLAKYARLDDRGVAHFLLPLLVIVVVALAGAYMVVSSNANPAKPTAKTVATAKKKAKKETGYLVVYGSAARYRTTKVVLTGSNQTENCISQLSPQKNASVSKVIPSVESSTGHRKFKCTAIGGTAAYLVYYGNEGKYKPTNYVTADVDAGYCTIVHPVFAEDEAANAMKMRKVPITGKDGCGPDENVPVTKQDLAFAINPALSSNKKGLTGNISLSIPEDSFNRAQCAGQVTVTYTRNDGQKVTFNHPIKFVKQEKEPRDGYCIASLSGDGKSVKGFLKKGATYTVDASFPGNLYFNPVSGTARETVTIP